jgi:hypothetical protein
MKNRETDHYYLKCFHDEFGLEVDSLLDRIESNQVPKGLEHYGVAIKCKNKWLRVYFLVESKEFYLQGYDSEGNLRHIML